MATYEDSVVYRLMGDHGYDLGSARELVRTRATRMCALKSMGMSPGQTAKSLSDEEEERDRRVHGC